MTKYDLGRYPTSNVETVAFVQTMVDANQEKITGVVFPNVVHKYNDVIDTSDVQQVVDTTMKHAWGKPCVYALNAQTLPTAPTLANLDTVKDTITRELAKGTNNVSSNMFYINGQAISSYILRTVKIPANIVLKCTEYRELVNKNNDTPLNDTDTKQINKLMNELDNYFTLATSSDRG